MRARRVGNRRVWLRCAGLVLAGAAAAAWIGTPAAGAQDASVAAGQAGGQASGQAAPRVRAARLTFVAGVVTVDAGGGAGSAAAQPNMPLLAGAQLATGDDGQAEVEFEDGSVVRLTPNSGLGLDTLAVDPGGVFQTGVSVGRGLVYAELRATPQYRFALSAGGDMLSPVENVLVRVGFDEPPASFAVLDGTAEVARADGSLRREVRAGETLRADGNGAFELTEGIAEDTWDGWNVDRDQAEAAEAKDATPVRNGYAGAQGYGWSDLDANGTWYDVPDQGPVWQPSVAAYDAGFDPYGYGAWMWYPGTGYVWASGYGWGWTPYRCGNWNYFGTFGWGWTPVGCGGYGWGFWPGGGLVNIALAPGGYRTPHVPRPRPGPVHPILPTRLETAELAGQTGWGTALERGARQINGVTVTPVERKPVAASLRAGSGGTVSALARDYPVGANRTPVVGVASTQPGVVHTDAGWVRAQEPGARPAVPAESYTGQSGAAMYRGQQPAGPAPAQQRPAYTPPQGQKPAYTGSGQAPRPGYSPPAQGYRPSYSPPLRPAGPPPAPPPHPAPAAHPR